MALSTPDIETIQQVKYSKAQQNIAHSGLIQPLYPRYKASLFLRLVPHEEDIFIHFALL